MYHDFILHIAWHISKEIRAGRVGRVRPIDIENSMTDVSRYRIRKAFKRYRAEGILEYHGPFYTLNTSHDDMIMLFDALRYIDANRDVNRAKIVSSQFAECKDES